MIFPLTPSICRDDFPASHVWLPKGTLGISLDNCFTFWSHIPGWWFGTCFIFQNIYIYINIWDNPSHWRTLKFFKMVKSYCTTNQYTYVITCSIWIPMDHFGMWSTGILDMSTSQKFEDWPCHVLENLISANRAGVPRGGYPNGMWWGVCILHCKGLVNHWFWGISNNINNLVPVVWVVGDVKLRPQWKCLTNFCPLLVCEVPRFEPQIKVDWFDIFDSWPSTYGFLRFLFLEASKKADFFFKFGYIKSDSPLHVLPYSSVFSWYPSSRKICHLCKCSIVQRIADQLAIVNQCVESFVTQWADEDFFLDPLQRRQLKNISYFTSLASESSLFNH